MIDIPPHIRGLVFDCDGTIADTMPLHYRAWVEALKEHGEVFPEALFYELAGISTVGVPEAMASMAVMPKGSYRLESTNRSAAR